MNDDNSNKERKVQDVGDEDVMYKPLLNDIDVETLKMILKLTRGHETGCIQGMEQEDSALRDEQKWVPQERPGTSGKSR